MSKTVRTNGILEAYNILSTAKYTKLDDADKIRVWKIARTMKPIAMQFDEDSKDAVERLKPEGFDERLQKAQDYERVTKDKDADASELEMGAAEYNDFLRELRRYNSLVSEAVKEYAEKEVKLDFEPLTEDAFAKLMASNDWTIEQVEKLDIITL